MKTLAHLLPHYSPELPENPRSATWDRKWNTRQSLSNQPRERDTTIPSCQGLLVGDNVRLQPGYPPSLPQLRGPTPIHVPFPSTTTFR